MDFRRHCVSRSMRWWCMVFLETMSFEETDIISIDCGVYYKGYHSDSAYTYPLEGVNAETLLAAEPNL